MYLKTCTILFLIAFFANSHAKSGFGQGEQNWGYVKVRKNAQLFWWLHYSTANVTSFYEKPLLIWLQGGPGTSSTGFGNFFLIGPLDIHLKPRKYNWVNHFNVLFIDSPVGTGFSFAKKEKFATTDEQVAVDLLACVKKIFEKDANLKTVPTYIFGESYGGKAAIELAKIWHEAEKQGKIESTLRGVAMGDSWISPVDSVLSWAPYLLQMGIVDDVGYKLIDISAKRTVKAVENNQWGEATERWRKTEETIQKVTKNVDFYNVLTKLSVHQDDELEEDMILNTLMNEKVKQRLNLTTNWGEQSGLVFKFHVEAFMKPVIDQVEYVLNNTNLKVIVYNGQLDLIVDTPGTMNWINNMNWNYTNEWRLSERNAFIVNNTIEGYVKKFNNFAVYWINRAGHMVPKDNPLAALEMVYEFTNWNLKDGNLNPY